MEGNRKKIDWDVWKHKVMVETIWNLLNKKQIRSSEDKRNKKLLCYKSRSRSVSLFRYIMYTANYNEWIEDRGRERTNEWTCLKVKCSDPQKRLNTQLKNCKIVMKSKSVCVLIYSDWWYFTPLKVERKWCGGFWYPCVTKATLFPQTCAINVQHSATAIHKTQLVITIFIRLQYQVSSVWKGC